jgi:ArsR family transcriptional regulator, virulence genes transcriptional regulator
MFRMTRTEDDKCACLKLVPALRRRLGGGSDDARAAGLLRLMAHPARVRILRALCEGDLCVCVICELLGRGQANVSQHLGKLRDGGLIESYPRGKLVYYRLRDGRVRRVLERARF